MGTSRVAAFQRFMGEAWSIYTRSHPEFQRDTGFFRQALTRSVPLQAPEVRPTAIRRRVDPQRSGVPAAAGRFTLAPFRLDVRAARGQSTVERREHYRADEGQPYRLVLIELGGRSADLLVETDEQSDVPHVVRVEVANGDETGERDVESLLVPLVDATETSGRRGRVRLEQVGAWLEVTVVQPELPAATVESVDRELLRRSLVAAPYFVDIESWRTVANALESGSDARQTIEGMLG